MALERLQERPVTVAQCFVDNVPEITDGLVRMKSEQQPDGCFHRSPCPPDEARITPPSAGAPAPTLTTCVSALGTGSPIVRYRSLRCWRNKRSKSLTGSAALYPPNHQNQSDASHTRSCMSARMRAAGSSLPEAIARSYARFASTRMSQPRFLSWSPIHVANVPYTQLPATTCSSPGNACRSAT